MRLFRGRSSPPATSYGYVPPEDATCRGWRCPTDDCGAGGDEIPRRWPFRCTACGGPADPEFDEPWAHDARGPWLRRQLASSTPGTRSFWEGELIGWRYRDALRAGDVSAAEEARSDAHRHLNGIGGGPAGSLRFHIVGDSIRLDRLDVAAEELTAWRACTVIDGVDADNARRTNCRQLLSAMVDFLEHPQAERHPATPGLRRAASALRDRIRDVLTVDLQWRTRHLHADHFEPAGSYAQVPADPVEQLVAFGRHVLDEAGSDLDPYVVWSEIVAPHYEGAVADPDGFSRRLAAMALPAGGWAVYGAQRLVVELLGGEYRGRDFLEMQDAALDWLHARGVSSAQLTGYEMARWTATRGRWPERGDPASDTLVVVLRSFVAATEPMINALRADDGDAESSAEDSAALREGWRRGLPQWAAVIGAVPRPTSASHEPDDRAAWWVDRVGVLIASLVAGSGITPITGDHTSVQPALAAAGRGLVLCALAHEHGVLDRDTKVRLLAAVLFDKHLPPSALVSEGDARPELVAAVLAELRGAVLGRSKALALGRAAWRLGKQLLEIRDELAGVRESLPRKGIIGSGLGVIRDVREEHAALRATAHEGSRWLGEHVVVPNHDRREDPRGR